MSRQVGRASEESDRRWSPGDPNINGNETVQEKPRKKDQIELGGKPRLHVAIGLSFLNSESTASTAIEMEARLSGLKR